jgi:hypothetical protein
VRGRCKAFRTLYHIAWNIIPANSVDSVPRKPRSRISHVSQLASMAKVLPLHNIYDPGPEAIGLMYVHTYTFAPTQHLCWQTGGEKC